MMKPAHMEEKKHAVLKCQGRNAQLGIAKINSAK